MKAFALAVLFLTLVGGPTVRAAEKQDRSAQLCKLAAATTITTHGEPYHLRLDGDILVYCDKRGARAIDLRASRDFARAEVCPAPEEPNSACSQLDIDVEVHAPLSAPDDVVDINGVTIPLKGRVRDCAVEGGFVAIATGSSINLIDVANAKMSTIDCAGGERVVVGPNWVVWSTGGRFRWISRLNR